MKAFLFLLASNFLLNITGKAQNAEDSVKTVVNTLFTSMKTSDSALLKTCFADKSILQTITKNKEGIISVKDESLSEFAASISGQTKGSLDEQIVFDMIRIDGPLAIVWTPYNFYYNGKFLHCGVNSFQLVKIKGEWKIQYLIDTRRKTGCKE
ncbi:MAG: nuclear transport factor 2 family protein [Ferruginibacter sp.]